MIICFSGEGNTLAVSRLLSKELGNDEMAELPAEVLRYPADFTIDLTKHTRMIWAFPVYSWGIPEIMVDVMTAINFKSPAPGTVEHYMVCTCGDDAGFTDRQWRRIMKFRGFKAMCAFSVIMPNTYVCMKGFDVDSSEVRDGKLAAMPQRVAAIAKAIKAHSAKSDIVRGKFAGIKSRIIYPWFKRHCTSPKPFKALDGCTRCGLCARVCPLKNITVAPTPEWGDKCAFCLRCYHICPNHTIAYGKTTATKGQYIYPRIFAKEEERG